MHRDGVKETRNSVTDHDRTPVRVSDSRVPQVPGTTGLSHPSGKMGLGHVRVPTVVEEGRGEPGASCPPHPRGR